MPIAHLHDIIIIISNTQIHHKTIWPFSNWMARQKQKRIEREKKT